MILRNELPLEFVFVTDIDPTIIQNRRYATTENFLGRPVCGYTSERIICTRRAAEQLTKAQQEFNKHGYNIVIYDSYRPQRATDEFIAWGNNETDQQAKEFYYPNINKSDVFNGYLSKKSGHTRGSTIDLSIIKSDQVLQTIIYTTRTLNNGNVIPYLDDNTVDMGSSFDLLHEVSHHDTPLVNKDHTEKRNFLRAVMENHGFKAYSKEWWHYTLDNEPFPDTYFDFVYNDSSLSSSDSK